MHFAVDFVEFCVSFHSFLDTFIHFIFFVGKDYPVQASTRDEMLVWVGAVSNAIVSGEYVQHQSVCGVCVCKDM